MAVVLKLRGLAVAGALLCSSSARADDVDAARRDFADGVRLYQRGDYEGARRLFKKADGEHHAGVIVYNLAHAEERLLHPQAAVDAYEAYVGEVGESGEFSGAAVVAIAQIKAHSTRLRLDTKPSGVRLFVDGSPLADPSPATLLVSRGHHVVVAQANGWRAEEDVEVQGTGDTFSLLLEAPVGEAPGAVTPPLPASSTESPSPAPTRPIDRLPEPPAADVPDGFVWGAAFALAPYHLAGARAGTSNADGTTQVIAGAILEAGHAVTDRFEFLGRGFVALGPDAHPTYAFMGGPGLSLRVGSSLWLGATFLGGKLETESKEIRYGTDLVFGAMAEATVVLIATTRGQWTFGMQPGVLLTNKERDNTAFFFPLTFGYRAY